MYYAILCIFDCKALVPHFVLHIVPLRIYKLASVAWRGGVLPSCWTHPDLCETSMNWMPPPEMVYFNGDFIFDIWHNFSISPICHPQKHKLVYGQICIYIYYTIIIDIFGITGVHIGQILKWLVVYQPLLERQHQIAPRWAIRLRPMSPTSCAARWGSFQPSVVVG